MELFWISRHSCLSYDPARDGGPLGPLTPGCSVRGKHAVQMDVPAAAAAAGGAERRQHASRQPGEAQGDLEVEG